METACFLILMHLTINTFGWSQANCQQALHTLLCVLPGMSPGCDCQVSRSGGADLGTQTHPGLAAAAAPWGWWPRQSGGVCCFCAVMHWAKGKKSWVAGKKCKWRWSYCKLTLQGARFAFPVLLHSRTETRHSSTFGRRGCVREQELTLITHSGSWVLASKSTWHISLSMWLPGLILIPTRS